MALVQSDNWSFDVNQTHGGTEEDMLVLFSAVLRDAGWTILNRGDGTTLTSDGSAHTSGDWQNANAYEHYQDPGGAAGREMTIERGATSLQCRCYMTRVGINMTGAAAGAAPTAPAADQAQLIGSGGSFSTSYISSLTNTRFHFGADSIAKGHTNDVYGFYWIQRLNGGSANRRLIIEPVFTVADGTFGDADAEPWIGWTADTAALTGTQSAWYKAGLTGSTFVTSGLNFNSVSNLKGLNPYTNKHDLPSTVFYDSTGGLEQRKGSPINMRVEGLTAHVTGQTYELSVEAEARCLFDEWAVRWPVNVAPIL